MDAGAEFARALSTTTPAVFSSKLGVFWLLEAKGVRERERERERETCSLSGSLSQRTDKGRFGRKLLTPMLAAHGPVCVSYTRPGDSPGMLEGASPNNQGCAKHISYILFQK